MDQFEAFFRKADLDGDGRISGTEAVAFLQGSNLPKQVLAQIWMHADQSKTGFLSRAEFYNALRLVTVAQSKRDLTPDIVKAALYGPAAAKIPAPQINLPATSAPQPSAMPPASTPHMGSVAPPSQNFGFRGPAVANANINQNYFPAQQNPSIRPPQAALPTGSMLAPNDLNSNISNNWLSGTSGPAPNGPRGMGLPAPSPAPRPQVPVSTTPQPTIDVSKTGNGVSSASSFGGNLFSATPSLPKSSSVSLAAVPVSSGPQPSNNNGSVNLLQDGFSVQPKVGQFQQPHAPLNPSQQAAAPGSSPLVSSGISVGMGTPTPGNLQLPWPKMKPSDVQKYTKVFMEVDTDRDGKITGEQARNLFLSWRLPREVLKQVWDLSDQDNDSMLSLREFCFALYLMERFREGRPLPAALPNNVMFDETLLSMTGQPRVNYGFGQQPGMPGAQPMAPSVNLRPPMPTSVPKPDGVQSNQKSSRPPVLENSFLDQRDNGHQNSTFSKPQELIAPGQKVEESKNVILDSKEKIELYRTKMQELVLYKSRCENKLNEITERASADKREAESLGKKYEERYKQVGEIASKLTIEEAAFRDIQERKMELNQAIIKMEQGGSVDGILQVRADRIQYDLEELMKALNERCKKHGLNVKSSAIIELPKGWEPGIQEGAAVWDEEWDKFEDEGFVNDLTIDVKNVSVPPTSQSTSAQREIASPEGALESESVFSHNGDEYARSPSGSPAGRTASGSPSQAFSEVNYGKDSEADGETHRSIDESWSAFDNNDEVDSVWGFDAHKNNDPDSEKHRDFFGSDSFSVNPVRTVSPNASSTFQRKSPFNLDDSVPSTPLSRFGSNSPRYSEAGDHYFDNFSRFDSFSTHDGGFSSQPERLTRFDSMNSSKDFGPSSFTRFDSMNSSKDFGHSSFTRFDSMNSSRDFGPSSFTRFDNSSRDFGHNPEKLTRFDSINSTKDFGHSSAFGFDDTDPFGSSGPFKVSSESQTSKKGSDNWSAF